jgi:hypothetical protein
VAGAALELLSLTSGPIKFNLLPNAIIFLQTPAVSLDRLKYKDIRIEARALPMNTFYRMDAVTRSATSFKWPMSLLHPTGLTQDLIGVVAWINQSSPKLHVPLSVTDSLSSDPRNSLRAILRSTVDVERLFWRTWPEDKTTEATPWKSAGSAYRAGQPIRIELPVGQGVTTIALSAKTAGSDDWVNLNTTVYRP